jgi:hypothetical protein
MCREVAPDEIWLREEEDEDESLPGGLLDAIPSRRFSG